MVIATRRPENPIGKVTAERVGFYTLHDNQTQWEPDTVMAGAPICQQVDNAMWCSGKCLLLWERLDCFPSFVGGNEIEEEQAEQRREEFIVHGVP